MTSVNGTTLMSDIARSSSWTTGPAIRLVSFLCFHPRLVWPGWGQTVIGDYWAGVGVRTGSLPGCTGALGPRLGGGVFEPDSTGFTAPPDIR